MTYQPPFREAVGSWTHFVLGDYQAMAGHRSQLYQSSNASAEYLADEIQYTKDKGSPA
jgi:hypothetical protein